MKRLAFLLMLGLGGCGAGSVAASCDGIPASILETTVNAFEDGRDQGMTYYDAIAFFTPACQAIDGAQASADCLECYNAIANQVYGR
jgi:hypothetical protein